MARRSHPSLKAADLSLTIRDKHEYEQELREWQLRLLKLQSALRDEKACPLMILFEGMDAAGKGGAIRRLTGRLDPRGYRVHPIGPPDDQERRHHYLWRFQQRMPAKGEIVIFDRSWYGRVLVERVEKLCRKAEWTRAYEEINSFEQQYAAYGAVMVKFWLHVSKKEQLRRFRERETDPFKEYKVTDEDWRNRKRWDQYVQAADEMFKRTHTKHAPWVIVSGEDKRHARVKVVETVVTRLERAIG